MKNISLILGIITSALIAASIYLYIQNLNSQSRISQLEKIVKFQPSTERDSLVRLLEVKNIQESQYLTNLNILSDWVIFYVTVLFGLVVAIQILNFEMRTKNVEQKYKEQEIANKEHFEGLEKRFRNLDSEINANMGHFYAVQAMYNMSHADCFILSLGAAESYVNSLMIKDVSDKNYGNLNGNLHNALEFLKAFELNPSQISIEEYFSEETVAQYNIRLQNLLPDLFTQEDKKMVKEMMKIIDRIYENYRPS